MRPKNGWFQARNDLGQKWPISGQKWPFSNEIFRIAISQIIQNLNHTYQTEIWNLPKNWIWYGVVYPVPPTQNGSQVSYILICILLYDNVTHVTHVTECYRCIKCEIQIQNSIFDIKNFLSVSTLLCFWPKMNIF